MKRVRLPLYLKILAWFFLNVVLLTTVFALLFQIQFHLNLDWLLATGSRERVEAVRDLVVSELNTTLPDEWVHVMDQFSEAYHLRFALFDDDANPLVGQVQELPKEVRDRILGTPPGAANGNNGNSSPSSPLPGKASPPPKPAAKRAPGQRSKSPPRPPVLSLMHTSDPSLYWLLSSALIDNPQTSRPIRVVLVANSSSISAGGLIFNPTPWLFVGLGAIVFSLLFWLPMVRHITRAVGRMTQATRQVAEGRFDVRVNMERRDELGSLAESIDLMATRLDGMVTGQKRFLGDIAHELCSPLARLQLALGVLEQRAGDDQMKFVKSAADKAEQIAQLVNELLSFSKASYGASAIHLRPVNVHAAATEAIRRETAEGVEIALNVAPELFVAADPDLLTRALANLLRNALRHAAHSGPITLRAAQSGEVATISIVDCGPGVPEEELPKIFEPFYRVDPARTRETGGAGLGLTIVKACINSCGGTVTAGNRQPHGMEVTIRLSATSATADE